MIASAMKNAAREFPATSTQSALWYIHQMDPEGSAYNIPLAFEVVGPLDVGALKAALEAMAARHEILRTVYVERDDELMQRVLPTLALDWEQRPMPTNGNGTGATGTEGMKALAAAEAARPFHLGCDAPMRVRLWTFHNDRQLLTIVFHHIAIDHLAIGTFVEELDALYRACRDRVPSPLPELELQFADYAIWAREQVQPHTLEQGLAEWKRELAGFSGVLNLPSKPGAARSGAAAVGDISRFTFPPDVTDAARAFARAQGFPLYNVLLGGLQTLLYQHAGQEDILVGTPFVNRGHDERLEKVLGCFINTLPIPVRVDPLQGFTALLRTSRRGLLHAQAHQNVPFESIVEAIHPHREPGLNPLYQVGFVFQDPPLKFRLEGVECVDLGTHSGGAMYDLHLWLSGTPEDGRLGGTVWYDAARFEGEFVRRLMERYTHLLAALIARPNAPIGSFPIGTPRERAELAAWNDTAREWPSSETMLGMFTEQARVHPHHMAVIAHSGGFTYAELLLRARQLSLMLSARGVVRGDLVGISMSRDLGMMVAILGVIGAGAAYVPLDPDYPDERLAYIAGEARLRVLITEPGLAKFGTPDGCQLIVLGPDGSGVEDIPRARGSARFAAEPDDLMYVIFTSGSTGRPKGVAVPHSCVSNFLRAVAEVPGFRFSDRLLAVTTLSFDIAVLELFLPLTTGGTVILADSEQARDGAALIGLLEEHDVTVMQATPSTWRILIDAGWTGIQGDTANACFRAFCGGEALPPSLAAAIVSRASGFWNLYGPTETTVWSMVERVRPGAVITIGQPLVNTTCHVLSPSQQQLPTGISGELYIGGAGVTAGYLHRPDLTQERFIANPFGDGRLYRTGDQVTRLPDGRLRYLGRFDTQVKVNGHRVELGEVESVLEEQPQVKQAAVMVSAGDDGDARLVAYVVGEPGESIFGSEVRRALRERLPDFMVPSIVLPLDAMPLTPNGKIDRQALPDPLAGHGNAEFVEPRTESERTVADVWCELLGVDRVGVTDNFFEIGGYSLLAIRATARLRDRVGVRPDPRAMFFQTLEQVAASLQAAPR